MTEVTTFHRLRRAPRLVSKVLFNAEVAAQLTAGTVANSVRTLAKRMPDMPDLHNFIREVHTALEHGSDIPPGATAEDGRTVAEVLEAVRDAMPEASSRLAAT
jgi:hypothetical protein